MSNAPTLTAMCIRGRTPHHTLPEQGGTDFDWSSLGVFRSWRIDPFIYGRCELLIERNSCPCRRHLTERYAGRTIAAGPETQIIVQSCPNYLMNGFTIDCAPLAGRNCIRSCRVAEAAYEEDYCQKVISGGPRVNAIICLYSRSRE